MLLFCVMARLGRVVVVNAPHHLTQRGNARRFVLDCDADRAVYLKLLRENTELYKVSLIGYCLMSNHIHLIAIPRLGDGLALARARVARKVLLLSVGRAPFVGSVALHRT
jgi:REP-associated tyrosine transposase